MFDFRCSFIIITEAMITNAFVVIDYVAILPLVSRDEAGQSFTLLLAHLQFKVLKTF